MRVKTSHRRGTIIIKIKNNNNVKYPKTVFGKILLLLVDYSSE